MDEEKWILGQGEILSSYIFYLLLKERGEKTLLVYATDFLEIDVYREPKEFILRTSLEKITAAHPDMSYFITQGFICKNEETQQIDTLGMGGSDYTASLIGMALEVESIEIWTDIDGVHNNDPRYISNTQSIPELSFGEASELAYFGAKILHPKCVLPAQKKNIPIIIKNTLNPKKSGSKISATPTQHGIKAIATQEKITIIRMVLPSIPSMQANMKEIFAVFEKHRTPIDMITTSEHTLSLSVTREDTLEKMIASLAQMGKLEVESDLCRVCIVGNKLVHTQEIGKILLALSEFEVKMMSYGSSENNMTIIIKKEDHHQLLEKLHHVLHP